MTSPEEETKGYNCTSITLLSNNMHVLKFLKEKAACIHVFFKLGGTNFLPFCPDYFFMAVRRLQQQQQQHLFKLFW